MYSFHASSSAYAEYWNNSFWRGASVDTNKVSRRQIWGSFVQESIRSIAGAANVNLEVQEGLSTSELTKEAFKELGEDGIIRIASDHACGECSQPYKKTAEIINGGDDPAALVGIDLNTRAVPRFTGNREQILPDPDVPQPGQADNSMDVDYIDTKMAVVDGMVTGPQKCAIDGCTTDVVNLRGGVFCAIHLAQY
ncbi:hypothetical protein BDZ94DRAFT_1278521, partial [Collybia nuda]